MRQWIRSHLTFANVVSLAALFVALGGTATAVTYVVSSNSQIGPGTISGHKPPSGKHANIIADSVTGGDVAENSLAKVPNADKLDGHDSTAVRPRAGSTGHLGWTAAVRRPDGLPHGAERVGECRSKQPTRLWGTTVTRSGRSTSKARWSTAAPHLSLIFHAAAWVSPSRS